MHIFLRAYKRYTRKIMKPEREQICTLSPLQCPTPWVSSGSAQAQDAATGPHYLGSFPRCISSQRRFAKIFSSPSFSFPLLKKRVLW